ncbi:hypothetical protein [Azospirillum baldaniorum]|uniref:hypothetical protein n=1 Tax=Azospirillum baldaniorum TaxID=1064539 RepID=UPI001FCAFD05|nr:hypothetical protein [Azospirillum baldaniorum]
MIVPVGGMSMAASASRAAIFGPASAPSSDQPARSRMLVKARAASGLSWAAISANSGASWVQATSSGAPSATRASNRSSWVRQSWVATDKSPSAPAAAPQALANALPSSAMLWAQSQTSTVRPLIFIASNPLP